MLKENNCIFCIVGHSERRQVFKENNEDIKIAEQHGIADQIFILLKGEAEFVKYHNNVFYSLATLKNSGSPLGISGLNAPGRYMSDIFIKGNSEYISFKIEKLKELEEIDPDYASFFYSYLLFESINLIWSSRNLEKPVEQKNINLADNKNDFLHHPHFALRGLKELHLTFEKR